MNNNSFLPLINTCEEISHIAPEISYLHDVIFMLNGSFPKSALHSKGSHHFTVLIRWHDGALWSLFQRSCSNFRTLLLAWNIFDAL